jgi:general secretion pathway protein N
MTTARAATPTPTPRVGWGTCALGLLLYVAAATGGIAYIERPSGSFWHGDATALVVTDQSKRAHRYGQLRWEFSFSRVLFGELQAAVVIDDPQVRGRALVTYRLRGIGIHEADLEMPAEKLVAHLPALAPARLSGLVSLRSNDLLVARDALAGTADITWSRAATELSTVESLGDYAARISAAGKRVEVALQTTRGPLHMEGRGTWSAEEGLTFNGTASAPPDRERELEAFLNLLGPKADGAHLLRIGAAAPATR